MRLAPPDPLKVHEARSAAHWRDTFGELSEAWRSGDARHIEHAAFSYLRDALVQPRPENVSRDAGAADEWDKGVAETMRKAYRTPPLEIHLPSLVNCNAKRMIASAIVHAVLCAVEDGADGWAERVATGVRHALNAHRAAGYPEFGSYGEKPAAPEA